MPAFDANGEEKVTLDLLKLAGNPVETGTGNAGDGTQRVVLADDQPAVPVSGSFWQATQPVSAASLPLPSGAATSAKQDTGNASLASLDSKITAVNTNAVTIGAALPAGNNNIGDVDIASVPAPTAIRHEQVSVGTSAVQLSSNAVLTGVNLKADDDNANSIYIGASGVTTSTGYRLKAGQSAFMAVDNANRLYAIAGAASQKLHVLGS